MKRTITDQNDSLHFILFYFIYHDNGERFERFSGIEKHNCRTFQQNAEGNSKAIEPMLCVSTSITMSAIQLYSFPLYSWSDAIWGYCWFTGQGIIYRPAKLTRILHLLAPQIIYEAHPISDHLLFISYHDLVKWLLRGLKRSSFIFMRNNSEEFPQ